MEQETLLSQETAADKSRPPEILTKEEIAKEDLKHTTNSKGWPNYWIPRLAEKKESLPKNLQLLVERVLSGQHIKRKGHKMAELQRYITKMLDKINRGVLLETVISGENEAAEIKQEAKNINDAIKLSEQANELILNQKLLPFLSSQEQRDIAMTMGKKGALKYWVNRLTPELDILRNDIKKTVEEILKTKKGPAGKEQSALAQYIRRRIAITKFGAEKRMEMANLQERLKQIDGRADYEKNEKEGRRNIFYDGENTLVRSEGGETKIITTGDVVGDYLWGIKYAADKSLPPAMWRQISKLMALKEARSKIENIFNAELSEVEGVSLPTSSWTYEFIEKHQDEGVLAERMAQSVLIRIQYNNPDSGIKIEASNALEDAELKYDFKVVLPRKKRGVALEGEELPRSEYENKKRKLGIQFTVTQNPSALEHKRQQLERARGEIGLEKYINLIKKPVDDIVLVSVPLKTYSECLV